MQISVLIDNTTLIDRYFLVEPALCFLLKDRDTQILFDTGYSDAFLQNAAKMDIDILQTDVIVLSHGHIDHVGGLNPLLTLYLEANIEGIAHREPTLIAHPAVFQSRIIAGIGDIGSPISRDKAAQHFQLGLHKKPYWITDRLVFLGEIPRRNDFENQAPIAKIPVGDHFEEDHIPDDSALVYSAADGLVIIAGCAHAGICNTIEYARELCGKQRVQAVIGGFHLMNPARKQLDGTLEYLAKLKVPEIYACHCIDMASRIALSSLGNLQETGVGLRIIFD